MQPLRHLPLALALGVLSAPPATDAPEFHPDEGSELVKHFVVSGDFALDDFSAVFNGEDVGGQLPGLDFTVETETVISVTDTYHDSADGRPVRLERTFDELEVHVATSFFSDMGGEDQDLSSSSDLEGETVLFEWDGEADAYDVSFAEEGADEDLLESLEEDMDFRALLPEGEVDAEDSWEVDVGELGFLLMPGGNLSFVPDDMDPEGMDQMERFKEVFEDVFSGDLSDFLDGTCTCTYTGTAADDDDLGEIALTLDVSADADLAEAFEEVLAAIGDEMGEEVPVEVEYVDLHVEFVGEGVLLWDLAAGRMSSFQLSGDTVLGADFGMAMSDGGMDMTAELSVEVSGTFAHEVETEE